MAKLFSKNKEDFICDNCGTEVIGDGYTNHCHKCLCSKHVDVNPGDRGCNCGGLMKVINIELNQSKYILTHKCVKCSFVRRNKARDEDMNAIIKWSKNSIL